MSATEIIAEIKKLPVPEQERVLAFLQDTCGEHAKTVGVRYASDEAFDKAANSVLQERADLFRRLAQ